MKKTKVGLLGLGRTGKVVAESLFHDRKFNFVFAVKRNHCKPDDYPFGVETRESLPALIKEFTPEIIIDFTHPDATVENVKLMKKDMGIVIATTGFTPNQLTNLKRITKSKKIKILYAPNISDGINITMEACKTIHKLWQNADIEIIEQHFKGKKDMPSGTAKKIAKLFNKSVVTHSVRAGGIVGIHQIIFAKDNQKIVIEHHSFSRKVFAEATKRAVKWLDKQPNGYYEISEMYQ